MGGLFKVAPVTRDKVGRMPHDYLKILRAERLYPAQGLLAIVLSNFGLHAAQNVNAELEEAQVYYPEGKAVTDNRLSMIGAYLPQGYLQLSRHVKKIAYRPAPAEVLVTEHAVPEEHVVRNGRFKDQLIPVYPWLQPAVLIPRQRVTEPEAIPDPCRPLPSAPPQGRLPLKLIAAEDESQAAEEHSYYLGLLPAY